MRGAPMLLVSILLLTLIPPAFATYIGPLPPSKSTLSLVSQELNSTTIPQKHLYNPATVQGLHQDIGKFSFVTSLTAITWNVTNQDFLQFNPPTLGPTALSNSLIYFNSTETAWQMSSGLNTVSVFVKPGTYSANIFIQANLASAQQVCFGFASAAPITQQQAVNATTGKVIGLLPSINAANESFSWSDILSAYSPTWNGQTNSLCMNLPIGQTIIDPIALDGSARNHNTSGTSLTCTLTTANSPDVIVVFARVQGASSGSDLTSISDTSTLSWNDRNHVAASGSNQFAAEWYAVAAGALTGDVITINWANAATFNDVTCFGVSGANTSAGTIFDTNAANPSSCTNASCTGPAGGGILSSIATNNANDMAIGWGLGNAAASPAAGAPWTSIQCSNGNFNCAEYDILSATTASLSLNFGGASMYYSLADAICQSGSSCSAATTVTQPIQILLGETGPSYPTIGISGCAVTNSTFTTANVHTYTLTASCSVTLSNPAATTYTRYKFNVSPKPTSSGSISFTTCASGTCSLYQNTTYYQLFNNFTEIAQSPNKWDGAYFDVNFNAPGSSPPGFNDPTGTYLGTVLTSSSSNDLCFVNSANEVETAQGLSYGKCNVSGVNSGFMWSDYGTGCWPTKIGNSWVLLTPCPSPTTGNNLYLGNYRQTTIASSFSDAPWVAIPIVLLLFTMGSVILYLPKKSRLRE